jgi:hypothetical protein
VQLDFDPFDARAGPGGRVEHAGASTSVVVEPGRTLALGGLERSRDARGAGLSGAAAARASDERLLVVSVSVE